MSLVDRHFLDFQNITSKKVSDFFSKVNSLNLNQQNEPNGKVVAHLFFESSTRTQLSFNMATIKNGASPLNFTPETSSMKKGETFLDTILTVEAMGVDAFVIRHGFEDSLKNDIIPHLKTPVISAGEGVSGHPTQALLDSFTILKHRGKLEGEHVLFIGDIEYSRVAKSNFELLSLMGAKIGICCPEELMPLSNEFEFEFFERLEDGLKWSSVCMALRFQRERHKGNLTFDFNSYQLNKNNLKKFSAEGIIMHPGPFNRNVEITDDVLKDPRSVIWNQVSNGVKIRTVLLGEVLDL